MRPIRQMQKLLLLLFAISVVLAKFESEADFEEFVLNEFERNQTKMCYDYNMANWNYNTDISNETKEDILFAESAKLAKVSKYFHKTYFKDLNYANFTKESNRRQAKNLIKNGDANLSEDDYGRLTDVLTDMQSIHSHATVCPFRRRICDLKISGLSLDPHIEQIFMRSENPAELAYYWEQYRFQTGVKIKPLFKEYVELKNKAAQLDNYTDVGDQWRSEFEIPNFDGVIDNLWNEIRPLYDELHFYVLHRLKEHYKNKINVSDGLIPAHITGDIHGHTWTFLISKVLPYPKHSLTNISSALKKQNFTSLDIFEMANEFFTSLGLEDMSMAFGERAVIERPSRPMVCHPTAWEFCVEDDFRISMCPKLDQRDFLLIHHELGHIQYYLQYRDQPITFRDAPNPGFHEAIGDAIVLSVMSSSHLRAMGLIRDKNRLTKESMVNNLIAAALNFVTVLPYAYILDRWRWDVFAGKVSEDKWNDSWWSYRRNVQKVKPPVVRSSRDFDAGSKYHVSADVQYISYFIATIMQFQMYRGLCIFAEKYHPEVPFTSPLHECDFYNSTEVGDRLKAGLQLGSSVHWSKVLELISGDSKLSTKPLLEYFEPLTAFLQEENKKIRHKTKLGTK